MMPKVSILLPNYNHKRYLQQRLDSIFEQTYPNFEVILLDDASSDTSVELLKSYANHPKVRHLLVNEENSGSPFRQWQKGIEHASGEYIWIAESDDWAEVTFLEKLLPLVEQEGVGFAFCNSNWVDEKGTTKKSLSIHQQAFHKSGKQEIKEHLLWHNSIQNVSAVLFDAKALKACSNNYIDYRSSGDWILYVELLLKYDLAFSEERLNYFRWYHDNTSNSAQSNGSWIKEGIDVLEMVGGQVKLEQKEFHKVSWRWIKKSLSLFKKTANIKSLLKCFKTIIVFYYHQRFTASN